MTDASFVIGYREAGRFDVSAIAWAAPQQYLSWFGGTIAGVAGATAVGDPARWGLDVLFPVFYLSLLLPELAPHPGGNAKGQARADRERDVRPLIAAALAGAVTLALTPIASPGVPVLVAAGAAMIGLRSPRHRSTAAAEGTA